jgi:basic membrane protein A
VKKLKTSYIIIGIVVVLVIIGVALVATPPSQQTTTTTQDTTTTTTTVAKEIKLAAIFPGTIQDADYNTLGYTALKAVESELGIKTAYSERVAVPDAERVIQEYISLGYNVIWTHGAQFNAAALKLADQNPNVVFIIETDSPLQNQSNNVWVIDRNFPPGFYVLGAIAAMVTKTGVIGYLGGVDLPFSKAEVNAVLMAIKDVNPNVQLKYLWVGDFNDPVKARSMAETLIASDADVILCSVNLGVYGVFEAVQSASTKVLVTVKYTDKSSMAPNNVITSYIYDFSGALKYVVKEIAEGNTKGYYKLQYGKDIYVLFPLKNVPQEVNDKAREISDKVARGEIQVPFNTTLPS